MADNAEERPGTTSRRRVSAEEGGAFDVVELWKNVTEREQAQLVGEELASNRARVQRVHACSERGEGAANGVKGSRGARPLKAMMSDVVVNRGRPA